MHRVVPSDMGTSLLQFISSRSARHYVEGAMDAGLPGDHIYFFEADSAKTPQLNAAKQAAAELLLEKVRSNDILLSKVSHILYLGIIIEGFSLRKD